MYIFYKNFHYYSSKILVLRFDYLDKNNRTKKTVINFRI